MFPACRQLLIRVHVTNFYLSVLFFCERNSLFQELDRDSEDLAFESVLPFAQEPIAVGNRHPIAQLCEESRFEVVHGLPTNFVSTAEQFDANF